MRSLYDFTFTMEPDPCTEDHVKIRVESCADDRTMPAGTTDSELFAAQLWAAGIIGRLAAGFGDAIVVERARHGCNWQMSPHDTPEAYLDARCELWVNLTLDPWEGEQYAYPPDFGVNVAAESCKAWRSAIDKRLKQIVEENARLPGAQPNVIPFKSRRSSA